MPSHPPLEGALDLEQWMPRASCGTRREGTQKNVGLLRMLNGLDLFSGIGGLTVALAPWVRPIAYCEQDRFAQSVLLSRMAKSDLPCAPIWDDVRTLRGGMLPGPPDVIYGGFPCQDISVAGDGVGLGGSRSGLFFEVIRLICELRPRFVFLENVPAITVRGLDRVLLELTSLGYDCRWTIVSAAEMGAPHLRERWWLLAHSVDHTLRGRHGTSQGEVLTRRNGTLNPGRWSAEPDVGRVAHGVSLRVDRLRGLGNAVVPACAREAFERLMGLK